MLKKALAAADRHPQLKWDGRSESCAPVRGERLMASSEHSVGFDPADRLAQDRDGVRRRFKSKFKQVVARLPFAEDLLAAYYCAFDRQTPRHVQASLLGAIAYFVLPFDFMPDMLPILGFTDDAAVLATAIRMVATHITPEHREAARAALKRGAEPADLSEQSGD
jgi:uncharacterized membrane protein YkvA (DUF1232 family)